MRMRVRDREAQQREKGLAYPEGRRKGLECNRMARGQTLQEQGGEKTNKLAQGKRNQRGLR